MNLNKDVAMGSMKMIAEQGRLGFLDGIGVSKGDFERLTGDSPWMNVERQRMTTCLFALLHASCDTLMIPRFKLPAEYIAAGISLFVGPINLQAACDFAQGAGNSEDMARGGSSEPCTAQQLFSLVAMLYDSQERNSYRALFEKKTNLALDKVMNTVSGDTKKK